MALPTQFSVTTGKVSPIANPKAPTDLPKKLEAEEVNIASGASLIPSLSATDTDSPSQLTAENAVTVGVPDSLTAQPVTVTIAPDALSAQPATITGNPDTFTALPVANTDSPDQLTAKSKTVTPTPDQLAAKSKAVTPTPDQLSAQSKAVTPTPDQLAAQSKAVTSTPDQLTAQNKAVTPTPDQLAAQSKTLTPTPDQLAAQDKASTPAPVKLTPNAGTPTTPPFPLNHARILYKNKLVETLLVTPSVGSGGLNTIKPNTFERWTFISPGSALIKYELSSNQLMDSFCIGGHNLDGAVITISYSATSGGSMVSFASPITAKNGSALFFHTASLVSARDIQININNFTGNGFISYASAGDALQMQRPFFNGHTPITDSDVTEYYSNRSESGEIIGQQIRRKGYETQAQWNNIDDGWYRAYFAQFKQYVKTRPFFFAWNLLEYPDDVGFCRINQDIRSPIQNGSTTKRTVNMTLLGAG